MNYIVLFKNPGSQQWKSTKPMSKDEAEVKENEILRQGKVTTLMPYAHYLNQGYRQHQRGSIAINYNPTTGEFCYER